MPDSIQQQQQEAPRTATTTTSTTTTSTSSSTSNKKTTSSSSASASASTSAADQMATNIRVRPRTAAESQNDSSNDSITNLTLEEDKFTSSPQPTDNSTTAVQLSFTPAEAAHIEYLQQWREWLGLDRVAPTSEAYNAAMVRHKLKLSGLRFVLREPLAEFFGTFVLILFGNGSVAQVVLGHLQTQGAGGTGLGFGEYQSISWGWGLGVMLGIYVAGDSGAFLNPAVMASFCAFRGFSWKKFPIYFVAQVAGAFVAAGVVYGNYVSAIDFIEGHGVRTVAPSPTATAGIFCTYPQEYLTKASQFFSEFITTAILMFVIFGLKDNLNAGAMGKSGATDLFPLCMFFLIFGLGACFGIETGYAINLARDFGPRLMSYALGYGHEVWSAGGYYFWIPMVAPFCGGLFGAFLYDLCIYTGVDSPLNQPNLGLERYARARPSSRQNQVSNTEYQEERVKTGAEEV